MAKGGRANLERLLRSAWEQQTAARLRNISLPDANQESGKPKWYESGRLFWGCLSLAAAIVLTVMAAAAKLKDLRWLLILVWPLTVVPLWLACREWKWRLGRWSAVLLLSALAAVGLWKLNTYLHPQTRSETIAKLDVFAKKGDWDGLAKTVYFLGLDNNQELRDVDLYYRGLLYSHSRPGLNPDHYLSQISPESDLFALAQEVRLYNYSLHPTVEFRTTIVTSLDRAGLRNPVYYRLRLDASPNPTFNELSTLYDEFVTRYREVFDFAHLKPNANISIRQYRSLDLQEIVEIPGCVLLFLFEELKAANNECLKDRKRETLNSYDMLVGNLSEFYWEEARQVLRLNVEGIRQAIEQFRSQPDRQCTAR